jgi:HK97 gp10 family phage protein
MREFGLLEFVSFLGTLPMEIEHANHSALEKAAVIVESEAKRVIGTYDYGWAPLAPSTLENKAADTPLLETGEMRDSIEHNSDHKEAHIGSNNDKALWQELGTRKIPPRPFLQGALQHKKGEVLHVIGREVVGALAGEVVTGENMMLPKP